MSKPDVTIHEKSFAFAVKVYPFVKMLRENHREFDLASQLLRASTSVYFNLEEAVGGHSERDFHAKVSISYKEARETRGVLRFLIAVGLLSPDEGGALMKEAEENIRILGSIQLTMRKKLGENK